MPIIHIKHFCNMEIMWKAFSPVCLSNCRLVSWLHCWTPKRLEGKKVMRNERGLLVISLLRLSLQQFILGYCQLGRGPLSSWVPRGTVCQLWRNRHKISIRVSINHFTFPENNLLHSSPLARFICLEGFYFWQGSLINYLLSKTDRTGRSCV